MQEIGILDKMRYGSVFVKGIVAEILLRSGILGYRFRRAKRPCCIILMYHRILEKKEISERIQPGMYVEKATFLKHLEFLKDRFSIIPIDRLPGYLKSDGDPKSKVGCILTFDDGWRDFYFNAFPALLEERAHATVFLTTDYIATKKMFWMDKLSTLLWELEKRPELKREILKESEITNTILSLRGSFHEKLERSIALLKEKRASLLTSAIEELLGNVKESDKMSGRQFLKWEEVAEMHKSGYVNFGSHTGGHEILTNLDENVIRGEIKRAKDRLLKERVVNDTFVPFSYPNGNHNDRSAEIVSHIGHSVAVTTKFGWNYSASNLLELKRIAVHQDISKTPAMLGARIAGYI